MNKFWLLSPQAEREKQSLWSPIIPAGFQFFNAFRTEIKKDYENYHSGSNIRIEYKHIHKT